MRNLTKNEQERAQALFQTELNNKLSSTICDEVLFPDWFYTVLQMSMQFESLISSRLTLDAFIAFSSGEKKPYTLKEANTAANIIQSMTAHDFNKCRCYYDNETDTDVVYDVPSYMTVITETTKFALALNDKAQEIITALKQQIETRIELMGRVPETLTTVGEA